MVLSSNKLMDLCETCVADFRFLLSVALVSMTQSLLFVMLIYVFEGIV